MNKRNGSHQATLRAAPRDSALGGLLFGAKAVALAAALIATLIIATGCSSDDGGSSGDTEGSSSGSGKFATAALLSIKGPITAKTYNAAVVKLKNQKSDMLCKPYYVGALPFHIPNNTNIIVDYKNGAVVVKKGCTDFQAVDKAIAQTRAFEKKFKLNTGT